MASGDRFLLVDAGSVQYVLDQFRGRVLRVFGEKPVVEGGPFTLDATGDEPRLVGRGPDGSPVHHLQHIIPWIVKIDATGDKLVITELRFRGDTTSGQDVFRKRSSCALTVDCLGGEPLQAQWFHRVAVRCVDAIPRG